MCPTTGSFYNLVPGGLGGLGVGDMNEQKKGTGHWGVFQKKKRRLTGKKYFNGGFWGAWSALFVILFLVWAQIRHTFVTLFKLGAHSGNWGHEGAGIETRDREP